MDLCTTELSARAEAINQKYIARAAGRVAEFEPKAVPGGWTVVEVSPELTRKRAGASAPASAPVTVRAPASNVVTFPGGGEFEPLLDAAGNWLPGVRERVLAGATAPAQTPRATAPAVAQWSGTLADTAPHVGNAKRFPSTWADDTKTPAQSWLIKYVMPESEHVFVSGKSKSGKTFWVLDACGAISRGVPWLGRRTKQATVTYVAAEGAAGFGKRLEAYRRFVGPLGKPTFAVVRATPDFTSDEDVSDLIATINANGGERRVVAVDTLSNVAVGVDENSSQMGIVIAAAKRIHLETGATVILIAHLGKDGSKGIRGWSGLTAASDCTIEIERDGETDSRTWKSDKQRDEEDGVKQAFKLERVTLGVDEDGDAVTSCIVRHLAGPVQAKPRGRSSAAQDAALAVLRTLPDVSKDTLISTAAERSPEGSTEKSLRSMRQAVRKLLEEGRLKITGGIIRENRGAHEVDDEPGS